MRPAANEDKSTERDQVAAASAELRDRSRHRGASADRVIDDRDPLTFYHLAQRRGNAVVRASVDEISLRECKPRLETVGDHLGEQGAAGHWTADQIRVMRGQLSCELVHEGPKSDGFDEQPIEIEPPVGVMAGFESEVAGASGGRSYERFFKGRRSSALALLWARLAYAWTKYERQARSIRSGSRRGGRPRK